MSEEEIRKITKEYAEMYLTKGIDSTKIFKYVDELEKEVEQLENIIKEAIEFMKENCDIITIDKGWIIRSELTTTGLGKLFKILNKGEINE